MQVRPPPPQSAFSSHARLLVVHAPVMQLTGLPQHVLGTQDRVHPELGRAVELVEDRPELGDDVFLSVVVRSLVNPQNHFVVLQLDSRRGGFLNEFQQVALSPYVVALAVQVVALRFAFLFPQRRLLLFDPTQL